MSKGTRSPRWVRAGLCAGAAVAVLIGGGSSYALWTDTKHWGEVESGSITAGSWTWDLTDTKIEWYDTSVEHSDGEGNQIIVNPGAVAYGDWGSDIRGYRIENIDDFRIVPGDRLTGVIDFGSLDENYDLEGQNLRARITGIATEADPAASGDLSLVVEADAVAGDGKIWVTITYPGDTPNNITDFGKTATVSLGQYGVTLEQVRPTPEP